MESFAERIDQLQKAIGGYRALARKGRTSDSTIRRWVKLGKLPFGEKEKDFAKHLGLSRKQISGYEPLPHGYIAKLEAERDGRAADFQSDASQIAALIKELIQLNAEHAERQNAILESLLSIASSEAQASV